LEEALQVPRTISDEYGKQPTSPLDIAAALDVKPTSGGFRYLLGASVAYGLTDGGPRVALVSLTDLGRRIVAPTKEGDDVAAMRQALLQPRVIQQFLSQYNGSKLPADRIGRNVLESMGVPAEATERTFALIRDGAQRLGLLREIKGDHYVQLDASLTTVETPAAEPDEDVSENGEVYVAAEEEVEDPAPVAPVAELKENRRVFITHGKNKKILSQLKELLTFGDFEPIVSIERETVSKPVPEKVLDDMRSCSAAIIHVGTEQRLLDTDGKEHRVVNQNVLIEIGAAMMGYGGKFILLVEEGTTLPSNLQGLYEVRYEGDELDYPATMKLLKAFNDFKG
jgi:predicted nucleotide-binding protein